MGNILCFIGEITVDFQAELVMKLSDAVYRNGHEITYCVNFDTNSVNGLYGEIEKKIMKLPDLDNYDGIILCADTYAIDDMAEALFNYIHQHANCPVISVRVKDERFYNVLLDDYPAICDMVEHFIVDHKFTRICFMTGRMELADARRRLKAYQDTMQKYNLDVTDGMIFYGDYWRSKGEEAISWFFANNYEPPEAIVCSNDYMAIAVCNALTTHGFSVPEDICVSGFDDIEETCYHMPPITSVHASVTDVSNKIIDIFERLWNGEKLSKLHYLPLKPVIRSSCGCDNPIDFSVFQKLYQTKEEYLGALHFCPYLGLDFEAADTISDLMYSVYLMLANKSYGSPDYFGTMYFCFCDESERQDNMAEMVSNFTENMILTSIISNSGVLPCSEKFKRSDILPAQYKKGGAPTFVVVLHCKDYCYGYIVMQNDDISQIKHLFKTLVFSIGSSLDRIRIFSENQTVQMLREQTYIDELTQIYNRRYMERYIRKLYERSQRSDTAFCVMSIDLDGLKYINDTFGHIEGDNAIKAAAHILDTAKPEFGCATRVGGDEFNMLFPSDVSDDAEKCIITINNMVEEFNSTSGKPYTLSMSIGYEYCRIGMDMMACIHAADKKMYEIKKAKKRNRRR